MRTSALARTAIASSARRRGCAVRDVAMLTRSGRAKTLGVKSPGMRRASAWWARGTLFHVNTTQSRGIARLSRSVSHACQSSQRVLGTGGHGMRTPKVGIRIESWAYQQLVVRRSHVTCRMCSRSRIANAGVSICPLDILRRSVFTIECVHSQFPYARVRVAGYSRAAAVPRQPCGKP